MLLNLSSFDLAFAYFFDAYYPKFGGVGKECGRSE